MNCLSFVSTLTGEAACAALEKVRLGELSSMGQVEIFIESAVNQFLKKYGPSVAAQLAAIAEPAAKKASEVIGPVVEEKLKAYIPTFAIITGVVIGGAYLIGHFISKRESRVYRRAA